MNIVEILEPTQKQTIARTVLEGLTDWFGIAEARENYIRSSAALPFFCAFDEARRPVGFVCLQQTGKATAELAVMGVLPEHHRTGIGRQLFDAAKQAAAAAGYAFLQVKTVQMGRYEEYDRTNRFYLSLGFQELEVFPTLWDENNPCQIYIMAL